MVELGQAENLPFLEIDGVIAFNYSERARKPRLFMAGDEWLFLIWGIGGGTQQGLTEDNRLTILRTDVQKKG